MTDIAVLPDEDDRAEDELELAVLGFFDAGVDCMVKALAVQTLLSPETITSILQDHGRLSLYAECEAMQ
jgi:hypothetical protein